MATLTKPAGEVAARPNRPGAEDVAIRLGTTRQEVTALFGLSDFTTMNVTSDSWIYFAQPNVGVRYSGNKPEDRVVQLAVFPR